MRVVDVADGDPLLETLYDDLLVPSFPPDELETLEWVRGGLAGGGVAVSAVLDDAGVPEAVAVGEWDAAGRVLLLSYLTVRPRSRSGGLGGLLMGVVAGAWQERFRPLLTLAEVEHPLAHEADGERGDPAARLRFYARHGARALDIPYFQPALRPGAERVHGMLLLVLARASGTEGERPDTVDPGPVRSFLEDYLLSGEEHRADGPVLRMRDALARPGGVRLLPLDDVRALPLSVPDGDARP
ncbi:N-acetyltransferase [Streptomyces barkulensis]|uniref:N-acetyltransferase n=1 Tax=Streptomyces barkulensis TaxID=1257026 RepID=UPI001F0E6D3A|nr:N-acetyltransferase [Streptomyces barkulensis]